jgi:hypothetical protein
MLALTCFRVRNGVLATHAMLRAEHAISGYRGWLLDADRVPGHWSAGIGDTSL